MLNGLGLQLYTVREHMKDKESIDNTFSKLAEMGYTEIQTAGLSGVDAEVFGELSKKHGLSIIGTHYNYDLIVGDPVGTMKVHDMWGTKNVGIGGMPDAPRRSYDELMKFIDTFNKTAEIYAKEGFKLTYHNHSFEFVKIKGQKTVMDYLYEELDPKNVTFILDTCWVAHGGADVRYWMEKLDGRIDILHLKDLEVFYEETGQMQHGFTHIGNGNLFWDGIIETAEKIGVKNYVVEQDGRWINNDSFESVKESAKFLEKYIK